MRLEITAEMLKAKDYVENTTLNVFLTGKAGSGKTTFLKYLLKNLGKRSMIVAPTGVAATGAGGVTIHSLFQLPHIMFCPETRKEYEVAKIREEKRKLIRMLDLLVIDEVSMVRADMLDAIDYVLQKIRRIHAPFGGVQLLMTGDLQQLSPVLKTEHRDMYFRYYRTEYFYGSLALNSSRYVTARLSKIFRQTDQDFLEILNAVRTNTVTQSILDKLNERYIPSYKPADGVIQVSTHVKKVDAINSFKFEELDTPKFVFEGKIVGKFPQDLPVEKDLVLREGTQVMFVRNNQRLNIYNGKIGVIEEIDKDHIIVACKGEKIRVEREEWENTEYVANEETGQIESTVVGTYIQYPLKYAWAITIHKSQGLTFDEAYIDVNEAFSHGQVYVALSRCRTLDGLYLNEPVRREAIFTDKKIDVFINHQLDVVAKQVEQDLPKYKAGYLISLIQQAFSFREMVEALDGFCSQILGGGFEKKQPDLARGIEDLNKEFTEKVFSVTNNFYRQYSKIVENSVAPTSDEQLAERLGKAAVYFKNTLKSLPNPFFEAGTVEIDGADIQQAYDEFSILYLKGLYVSNAIMEHIEKSGFTADGYLSARTVAEMEFEKKGVQVFGDVAKRVGKSSGSSTLVDRELLEILSSWRKKKAEEQEIPAFSVLRQSSVVAIAQRKPLDKPTLAKLEGIGKIKIDKYGDEIIAIVRDYAENHRGENASTNQVSEQEEKYKKSKKPTTYEVTLSMLDEGSTPEEIAESRNLSLSTIYNHVVKLIYDGNLELYSYISNSEYLDFCDEIESDPEITHGELEEIYGKEKTSFLLQLRENENSSIKLQYLEYKEEASVIDSIIDLINENYTIYDVAYILGLSPREVEEKVLELLKHKKAEFSNVVSVEKQNRILSVIDSGDEEISNVELKNKLPYYCSYFDIRIVKLMRESSEI